MSGIFKWYIKWFFISRYQHLQLLTQIIKMDHYNYNHVKGIFLHFKELMNTSYYQESAAWFMMEQMLTVEPHSWTRTQWLTSRPISRSGRTRGRRRRCSGAETPLWTCWWTCCPLKWCRHYLVKAAESFNFNFIWKYVKPHNKTDVLFYFEFLLFFYV